ncbi:uncharacterized protein DUF3225 [Paraburkholderia rhizosphaerae]|uniref:Uncharacterized protein DUF3225 n=1 Tax=Paraburkholderia rhizosphaerae TaxID=480658 RepID=A0A4R8LUR1_9BURK|nr:uncharacterized protein DUF3225 [Paraburkholderia rhizosphaerae]
MQLNLPHVVAEVYAAFRAYERALVDHDNFMINALFWQRPDTVRYGIADRQHGCDQIRAFHKTCAPVSKTRQLQRTVITTFAPISPRSVRTSSASTPIRSAARCKPGPRSAPIRSRKRVCTVAGASSPRT